MSELRSIQKHSRAEHLDVFLRQGFILSGNFSYEGSADRTYIKASFDNWNLQFGFKCSPKTALLCVDKDLRLIGSCSNEYVDAWTISWNHVISWRRMNEGITLCEARNDCGSLYCRWNAIIPSKRVQIALAAPAN